MFKEPIISNLYKFPNEWHSWKVDDGSSILSRLVAKLYIEPCTQLEKEEEEIIEILCGESTGCKEAGNNDDYHRSRQRQTFQMSVFG